ncbi:hypothetical protein BT93_L0748 [Corymbia citriodora subsp. variegata]|uniref:Uncharacterized protein n=1 Tax=Corymbia citriodora subsp. variegata TaxID=360336 RepID=A0A8T0CPH9_CORYI|nr:hypothetical protein BT93_L0748 [Corymbia citriodora subsp. variegata]
MECYRRRCRCRREEENAVMLEMAPLRLDGQSSTHFIIKEEDHTLSPHLHPMNRYEELLNALFSVNSDYTSS